jgi:MoxR-like ATPase
MARLKLATEHFRRFQDDLALLQTTLQGAIVGQERLIFELITAVLAGGHVLLEGMPGLGKTHLAKALAKCIDVPLGRIQCTPDLMPADVTGSEILVDGDGHPRFEFRAGPIFAPMVLVDEINRATPKTQAALLEAMQEGQVTYAGNRYGLPSPFWIFATQNPIEFEGTYPLPEAQLDRFAFKIKVEYPSNRALLSIADQSLDAEPEDHVSTVVPLRRIKEMMAQAREVVVARSVKQAVIALVLATHPDRPEGSVLARAHFRYGASPRALQSLLRAARVRALADGRGHVAVEDLEASTLPVLRHRVSPTLESELAGVAVDEVLGQVVAEWSKKH